MMDEQMMAFIQTLPPEKQQALMASMQPPQQQEGMGLPGQNQAMTPEQKMQGGDPAMFRDYAGEQAVIGDQQAQAEALRQTPSAQGIQTANAGFVAANPLSHVVSGLKQGMGNYQAKQALDAKKALSADTTKTQQGAAKRIMDTNEQVMANELRKNRRGDANEQMAANSGLQGFA